MNKKVLILAVVGGILGLILIIALSVFGYKSYMQALYKPGVKELENRHIAIIYCSQGDNMQSVVDNIAKKIKVDAFQIKPVVPYPTDSNALASRIKQENANIAKVLYTSKKIDIKKYGVIAFGTPLVQGDVCPVLKKFINDNYSQFKNKPVAKIITYKKGEDPKKAMQYFYYRLGNSYTKPGMILEDVTPEHVSAMSDIWLSQMEFKREEFKNKK